MARETGLEPATSTVTGWHSNQLSYSPASYQPGCFRNLATLVASMHIRYYVFLILQILKAKKMNFFACFCIKGIKNALFYCFEAGALNLTRSSAISFSSGFFELWAALRFIFSSIFISSMRQTGDFPDFSGRISGIFRL